MATVNDLYEYINGRFPFSDQEAWDNSGLLCGSPDREVTDCVVSLDADEAALRTAKECGAQLLITHHPIIFSPLRALDAGSPAWQAAGLRLSVISTHTPFDKGDGGTSDTVCGLLGLRDVRKTADGFLRLAELPGPTTAEQFARRVSAVLSADVSYTLGSRKVGTVAVCTGAGGDEYAAAMREGADCLLTGEAKYHDLLAAKEAGFPILAAGHYETEVPAMAALILQLAERFPDLRFRLSAPGPLTGIVKR